MNRRAIGISAALLALAAAFAIGRVRRKREVAAPSSTAAEIDRNQQTAEPAFASVGAPPQASDAASASNVVSAFDPELGPIAEAIEASYASTLAAFSLRGEDADYEAHDAQAQRDADRLQQLFSSTRAELSPELASACEALLDRIGAAQLQLMAFAINRKNRGLPDSAQVEAELDDREAFQKDAQPLFERLKSSF